MNIRSYTGNYIDVVFFDLFYTLITPAYPDSGREYELLGISESEWESYAEDDELFRRRATGRERDPHRIIEAIVEKMRVSVDASVIREIAGRREERMKRAMMEVDPVILDELSILKNLGFRLCLITNADTIDVMHWEASPLRPLFDNAVISCEVGHMKPKREIYHIACDRAHVKPENSIFVGDGGSDELRGAREAGMKTILTEHLLTREPDQRKRIKGYASFAADDFRDIRRILTGQ